MIKKAKFVIFGGLGCVVLLIGVIVTHSYVTGAAEPDNDRGKRYIPQRGSTSRPSHGGDRDETVGRTRIRAGSRSASESEFGDSRLHEDLDEDQRKIHTFFSLMPKSFGDIPLHNDEGIPVTTFLDACRAILPIFDKLNPTAFAPVKLDVAGNIRKIQQKYSADPKHFRTLQAIISHEIKTNQHKQDDSATNSLLWLKRALEFIKEFLVEFLEGQKDLGAAASNAYSKSLHQFHGWVLRGVFALAMKAVPYRSEFIEQLANNIADKENPNYESVLFKDVKNFTKHLTEIVDVINDFYIENGLETDS